MQLFKEYIIHASRFLPKLPDEHICSKMHGHTFYIKLDLEGELNPKDDFVIDFYDLDTVFNKHIGVKIDHKILNEVDGLESPTTELLTKWIWNNLKPHLNLLSEVTVREGSTYGCTYRGNS